MRRAIQYPPRVGDSATVLLLQVPSAGGRDGKESFVTDDAWREHAVHLVSLLQTAVTCTPRLMAP